MLATRADQRMWIRFLPFEPTSIVCVPPGGAENAGFVGRVLNESFGGLLVEFSAELGLISGEMIDIYLKDRLAPLPAIVRHIEPVPGADAIRVGMEYV
jgi:hypothetical protein